MIVEHFKDRDPQPVYKRFAEKGRMASEGLKYLGSWIEANLDRCFQLMECDDPKLIQQWILEWRDLVDFEVVPVVDSQEFRQLFPGSFQD